MRSAVPPTSTFRLHAGSFETCSSVSVHGKSHVSFSVRSRPSVVRGRRTPTLHYIWSRVAIFTSIPCLIRRILHVLLQVRSLSAHFWNKVAPARVRCKQKFIWCNINRNSLVEVKQPIQHPVLRIEKVIAGFKVRSSHASCLRGTKARVTTRRQGPISGGENARLHGMRQRWVKVGCRRGRGLFCGIYICRLFQRFILTVSKWLGAVERKGREDTRWALYLQSRLPRPRAWYSSLQCQMES